MLNIRLGLETLKPYSVEEIDWQIKLDANEEPRNLPPAVRAELMERISSLAFNRYPEINGLNLRRLISERFSQSFKNVLVGSGSNGILAALCFAYGGQGRSVVYPNPSFAMYGIYAKLSDSKGVAVEMEPDFSLSVDKILTAAEKEQAAVIILCNPNNPTGGIIPLADIEYIAANAKCLVVVDEAYYEFYGQSAVGLLPKYPRLAVTRTFSKAYCLAAARVGYMLASEEVIETVGKVLLPYNVNTTSLIAAETVWQMRDQFEPGIGETVSERKKLAAALEAIPGVEVFPSETNFLLIRVGDTAGWMKRLADQGIGVRDFNNAPGLSGCLRVTVGTPAENQAFLKAVAL
ncbi:MAG TPA: histidinol-phosphate transaminase [Methylomusa anaerophila]|uniref:Histidinol-phosphate aminotransferase n=1 Tax=Methylomusa anaerophila TaxID=1930071 RepID=A0A348AMQ8_9FIRM|nr:histidinol-phosphate transaminase [Methylomusa anaerophila]BBB92356.1 histidinol-phosphate aminotransferase 2 [Methylomusa anaerophila]HML90005.1 histidinol-phosphate transaminase [Methylomusa anaerophila]